MTKNTNSLFAAICFGFVISLLSQGQTNTVSNPPPVPTATTNAPTPPKFPLSLVPASASNEIARITREAIDQETRPKVKFQKKKFGNLTNEWETILVLEPYQLQNFYRVIIEE